MLEVRDLNAWYGKSHILRGVQLDVRAGEIVSLLGRNGVGRSTTLRAIMGLVQRRGSVKFKGRELSGLKAFQIAHAGLATCRKTATPSRRSPCARTCSSGRSPRGGGRWTMEHTFELFPNLKARAEHAGRRAVGRRAADAHALPHADGRPGARHDRRADRGLAPKLVEQVASFFQEVKKRGISILLVEQKLAITLDISGAPVRDGARGHRLRRHGGRRAQNAAMRKEWLEV
jgi:branched-chain amino acid transport system ATP-binding protein